MMLSLALLSGCAYTPGVESTQNPIRDHMETNLVTGRQTTAVTLLSIDQTERARQVIKAMIRHLRMQKSHISDRPVLSMVTSMLDAAFVTIPDDTGLILHSDQGWQYQHKKYQEMLHGKGIRQSMSRKGNCLDNAVMENFFGLLKSELLYLQDFDSLEHFKAELVEYLDYYNNRRIKLKLKGLTPAQHRYQTLQAA